MFSVAGGLSEWGDWGKCTSPCGRSSRNRACSNPKPQNGGQDCVGVTEETVACYQSGCGKLPSLFVIKTMYLVFLAFSGTSNKADML